MEKSEKKQYRQPEAEILHLPLEGFICQSGFSNPEGSLDPMEDPEIL